MAITEDQKKELFDIYYLSRFNREVALVLGTKAGRWDTAASAITVVSLVGSLIAGGLTFAGSAKLQPVWGGLNILATGFGFWALIRSWAQRRAQHDSFANQFEALMLRIETYSGYAARIASETPGQINQRILDFQNEYNTLMVQTSADHKRYSDKHEVRLQQRLDDVLLHEGKL